MEVLTDRTIQDYRSTLASFYIYAQGKLKVEVSELIEKENLNEEEDYSWSQELRDWEERQDYYERFGLDNQELSNEWEDGIPPEIQKLIDWYKQD